MKIDERKIEMRSHRKKSLNIFIHIYVSLIHRLSKFLVHFYLIQVVEA